MWHGEVEKQLAPPMPRAAAIATVLCSCWTSRPLGYTPTPFMTVVLSLLCRVFVFTPQRLCALWLNRC